jgi:DNA-binding NarL/FixJ family response regulator
MSSAWTTTRALSSAAAGDLWPWTGDGVGEAGLTLRAEAADERGVRLRRAPSPMRDPSPITVLLAHFEDLLALGLRSVIDGAPSLEVVADDVAHERLEVVLRAHHPQVAILDADALPTLAHVRDLTHRHPETRLVLLTGRPTAAECAQVLAFGASACLGRDTQGRDVISAIHLASRGLQLIPRRVAEPAAPSPPGAHLLTAREAEIVIMLQHGSSNAEIATALQVGVETIRTHARNIYRKLGVTSRLELVSAPPRTVEPEDHAPVADPPHRRASRDRDGQRRRRAPSR